MDKCAYTPRIVRKYETELAVVGGGPAGLCAAVAAARHGCRTILVEQGGYCGGMATRGLVGPFMTCYDKDGQEMIIRGLFEEIVERLIKRGGAIHPSKVRAGTAFTSWIKVGHDHVTPFEPEALKLVSDEMLAEAGVQVLYHTQFLSPVMDGNRLTGLTVSSKAGVEEIKAKTVIDCTGDGDVAFRCGVSCGEDGFAQPATMFFRIGGVDSAAVEAEIEANLQQFYRKDGVNYRSFHWLVSKARENGDWHLNRTSVGLYRGVKPDEWFVNTSRLMGVDATDNQSLTQAEIIGRQQADEIFNFIKKYIPGCANARLISTGNSVGIRESRHICGRATMDAESILEGRVPADTILLAANSIDIHGKFGSRSNEYLTIEDGEWYGIPYGCLVPQKVENLLVAGRCVSATSEAAGAIRVMPPCMGMGQAAGTAAALAAASGVPVSAVNISQLQSLLRGDGAYLPIESNP